MSTIANVPSFLYSPLDEETKRLTEELESLGGGDAKAINMGVHCVVDERLERNEAQVIWRHEDSIELRDALMSRNSPRLDCMKRYKVTAADNLTDVLRSPADTPMARDLSRWVLDGFNASLIAYGPRSSGKTVSLFGLDLDSQLSMTMQQHHSGIVPAILQQVYQAVNQAGKRGSSSGGSGSGSGKSSITVGLSAWSLCGQTIVDLLAAEVAKSRAALEFASVECPSYQSALQVIAAARERSIGAQAQKPHLPELSESMRAHFFLRILLHNEAEGGQISHIHIVDLIGNAFSGTSLLSSNFDGGSSGGRGGVDAAGMDEAERIARRDIALQLKSFAKVLSEMRSLSIANTAANSGSSSGGNNPLRNRGSVPPIKVTSARDSKLTCILAPLLQGNSRTAVMSFLRDGESHYASSKAVLSALDGVTDIVSACYRVRGVSLESLDLRHTDSVLRPVQTNFPRQQLQQQQQYEISRSSGGTDSHTSSNFRLTQPVPQSQYADHPHDYDYDSHHIDGHTDDEYAAGGSGGGLDIEALASQELEELRSTLVPPPVSNSLPVPPYAGSTGAKAPALLPPAPPAVQSSPRNNELSRLMGEFNTLMQDLQKTEQQTQAPMHGLTDEDGFPLSMFPKASNNEPAGPAIRLPVPFVAPSSYSTVVNAPEASSFYSDTTAGAAARMNDSTDSLEEELRARRPTTVTGTTSDPSSGGSSAATIRLQVNMDMDHRSSEDDWRREFAGINAATAGGIVPGGLDADDVGEHRHSREEAFQANTRDSAGRGRENNGSTSWQRQQRGEEAGDDDNDVSGEEFVPPAYAAQRGGGGWGAGGVSVDDHHYPPAGGYSASDDDSYRGGGRVRTSQTRSSQDQGQSNSGKNSSPVRNRYHSRTHPSSTSYTNRGGGSDGVAGGGRGGGGSYHRYSGSDEDLYYPEDHDNDNGGGYDHGHSNVYDISEGPSLLSLTTSSSDLPRKRSASSSGSGAAASSSIGYLTSDTEKTSSTATGAASTANTRSSKDKNDKQQRQQQQQQQQQVVANTPAGSGGSRSGGGSSSSGAGKQDPITDFIASRLSSSLAGVGAAASDYLHHFQGNNNNSNSNNISFSLKDSLDPVPGITIVPDETAAAGGDPGDLSEVERLRRNNSSLLLALNEERAARDEQDKRILLAHAEVDEIRTQSDLKVEDYRLNIVRLNAQIRALSKSQSMSDVYDTFEEHVTRLSTENESLRKRNLELESRELDTMLTGMSHTRNSVIANMTASYSGSNVAGGGGGGGGGVAVRLSTSYADMTIGGGGDSLGVLPGDSWEVQSRALEAQSIALDSNRMSRVVAKLKRVTTEKDAMRKQLEEMHKKDRQHVLSSKMAQDASRRLQISHQEVVRLKKELDSERLARGAAERDLMSIKEDTRDLQHAEKVLREERAKWLDELALLRERVRELDEERNRIAKLNRSVAKHVGSGTGSPGRRVPDAAVPGVAGLSNGKYFRIEETGFGSVSLENSLSTLHDGITASCPSLLPAFRRVTNEIHNDRARMLQQRAELLGALTVVKPAGSLSFSGKQQQQQQGGDRGGGGTRSSTHGHSHSHSVGGPHNVSFQSGSFAGMMTAATAGGNNNVLGASTMSMVSNDRSGEMKRGQSLVDMTSGGIYSSRSTTAATPSSFTAGGRYEKR